MYNIKDLSIISGLTERTLRNYLKMGILVGQKEDGKWHFSEEQISAFLENDYVKPAIKAKRNSVLFDYLKSAPINENTACIVLHLPKDNSKNVATFFCDAVNKRNGLAMTFDKDGGINKVILVGTEEVVYDVLAEYHAGR